MRESSPCIVRRDDGRYACSVRGIVFSPKAMRPIRCICETFDPADVRKIRSDLPGTELKKIIASWQRRLPWFDLSPGEGCACEETARWMNRLGPDGCEEKMEEILDKLEAEAKKRNLSIPFQRFWAKRMVKQAIRRARKLSQGGN